MAHEQETGRHIARRAAIQRIAAAGATVGVAAILGGVQTRASEASKHFAERQPIGSEIWQVTTEDYWHWNIYCEVPYCSADSKYFVYSRIRRNPTVGINRTEFMVVELGTWKQHQLDVGISTAGCAISEDGLFYYLKENPRGGHARPVERRWCASRRRR